MDAGRHPGIEILVRSEVTSLSGEPGAFRATILRHPTGVDPQACTACGDCAEVCPVVVPNEFDAALGSRKAIYRPFPQSVPAAYVIDQDVCLNDGSLIACERCRRACPAQAIDLEMRPSEVEVEVGAVVVATGFDEFQPAELLNYGYGRFQNVLTSLELERLLDASGPTLGHVIRPSDRQVPHSVVYVQCVGSRGEAQHPWCSRYCCMNAVKDALLLHQHHPEIEKVTILYMDIRAFGKGFDALYERARQSEWVEFLRGRPSRIFEDPQTGDLEIHVENTETGRRETLKAGMVVLSCAGLPSEGTETLAMRLGIHTGAGGFIQVDTSRGPVASTRAGIFVCGSATGPQVIPDCVAQGSAAAAEAAALLKKLGAEPRPGEPMPAAYTALGGALQQAEPPTAVGQAEALDSEDLREEEEVLSAEAALAEAEARGLWADEMPEIAEIEAAGTWSGLLGGGAGAAAAWPPQPTEAEARGADGAASIPSAEQAPPAEALSDLEEVADRGASGAGLRVGVVLCHCGVNIAGVLDMNELNAYAQGLPDVVFVSQEMFACSGTSQQAIQQAIAEHRLNRLVVAACTPRTHEPIFRENCRAAGLNPYLFEMANIRDQCSWVHSRDPKAATRKAKDLIRMAVARARRLEPLESREVEVSNAVLVVGAGVAGLKAASDLADLGLHVTVIDQSKAPGGLLQELYRLYPNEEEARSAVASLLQRLAKSDVDLLLGARVRSISGFVGNFRIEIDEAAGNGGGAGMTIEAGAIVLATGAEAYRPSPGEFAYGAPNVVTSLEFERLLADGRLKDVRTVGFIQCVGSRLGPDAGERGGYAGCSRICCPTTVKQVLALSDKGIRSVVLYRDMRVVGPGAEELYRDARRSGAVFLRYVPEAPPAAVTDGKGRVTALEFYEPLLGERVEIPVDLLVLAVGLRPASGEAERVREMLKVPRGTDGFLLERHPELGPVETCVDGVVVCGTSQAPKGVQESLVQASAAAAKVAALLGRGRIELDPAVCTVDAAACRGCGLCVSICEFQAPSLVEEGGQRVARINPALCKGCGTCAAWCPSGAIQARHFTDEQIRAMIDSLFVEAGRGARE